MLKVEIVDIENNYEDKHELKIYHNNILIESYYDYGEPEDNSFIRDYSWIAKEIERAYKLGKEDAKNEIITED